MAIEARLADGRILRFPDGTNPSVIDSTVQSLLAEGKPSPAQASESEAEFDFGNAMGTGADEIMAQPNRERKTYTGSVFDTQPFEPKFNPQEAARLSRRDYAEKKNEKPRRTQYARATPADQLERSTGQKIVDTGIGLLQGAAAFPKGIAGMINAGDNPVAEFYEEAIQAGERAKSPYLRSQKAEREAFIKNVTDNQGELAGARATFNSMFSPAGADIISQGAGSILPTVGMSLLGLAQKSMTAVNALSVGGEAAQNTAQKLMQMSPENWSNSSAYQELRSTGMSHKDAVNMLAPLFALPNQALGLVIGGASGSTGLEKKLAGKAVTGGAKERASRAAAEFVGEEAETLIPSFAANVTRRIFDDKQALTEGLGKEAVETAAGTIPGAALAATGKSDKPPTQPVVNPPALEPEVVAPTQERVEPTFDEAAFTQPAPPVAQAAVPVAPTEQVKEIAARLQRRGISRKAALAMAEREVAANAPTEVNQEGTENVAEPISEPSGGRVAIPAQPTVDVPTTAGTEQAERDGVVPAEPDAGEPADGKGTEPVAVEAAPALAAETKSIEETEAPAPTATKEKAVDVSDTLEYFEKRDALIKQLDEASEESSALLDKMFELDSVRAASVLGADGKPLVLDENGKYDSDKKYEARKTLEAERDKASAKFDAVIKQIDELDAARAAKTKTEGAPADGTQTTETVEATQEGQAAPAATGVSKGKRGRPPVVQKHVVTQNAEGGFDHVTDGEVTATYANNKQATAAVNLAKARDKGDANLIAKNQAKLDAALASRGRGRPEKVASEDGTTGLSQEDKVEMNALEAALETYNSPVGKDSVANSAMYISDVAVDPDAPKAVRERAKQMLEDDVDPKDIPKKLRSSEGKVGKPDTGFSDLTTGTQAIAQIVKTGTLFQRSVAQRIRNYMVGVKFVVVEKGDSIPAEMSGARGLFEAIGKERTVYVRGASFGDQQGINNITVLHELLHAATASRIYVGSKSGTKNPQLRKFVGEIESLMQRAQEAYKEAELFKELPQDVMEMVNDTTDYNKKTGKVTVGVFEDPNEFLAYGMSSPVFQKFLMGVEGMQKEETAFSKFVRAILDLFGLGKGNFTALSDLVNITDKMLDADSVPTTSQGKTSLQQKGPLTDDEKAQRAKERAVTRALTAVDRSFEAEKISEETEVLQRLRSLDVVPVLKEVVKGMSSLQKKAIAKTLSTPLVAEIGGINVEELVNTNRLLEEMEASKMEMLRAGAKLVEDVKRLVPTQESQEKVSRAALIFTASRIDPRTDKSVVRLNKIYDDLTADEKKALDEVAGYYDDIADNFDYILGENAKALRPGDAAKLTATLREVLGKDNRIPFYVPLARDQNGEFFLRVGTTEFHIRKTEAERDRLAESIAKERNTTVEQLISDREIEVGNDIGVLRKKVLDSSDALRKIFLMIEDADFTAEEQGASLQKAKDGMKDSVFQLWLHMQPESSSRKQFIHRNKYPPAGFRTDIIQNLSESVLKFSNNIARLEYAPQLRRSVSQAHAAIAERPEYSPYVSEMALRVNDTLAPDNQSMAMGAARFANSFTFGYYMSESTALLQLLSVYQVGTAQLAKQYPMAAVAKEVAKMSQVWNTIGVKDENGEWVMPTIEQALNLKTRPTDSAKVRLEKEQDRAFIDAMHERNVSESTGARDLQGYKDLPTEKYGSKYEQAKRVGRFVVGGLIHATERLSREFMFMSSAHLIRDKAVAEFRKTAEYQNAPDKIAAERAFGEANMDTWADKAAKDTNAALFNYSESAKPRYMRGPLGKIALQFFTYQLNVGSFIARNFIGMIKPLPGDTRVECMRAFSTLMATTFSLGGTSALFGGPIVIGFISLIMKAFKGEDEPDELKDIDLYERFKIFVHEQLGDVMIGGAPLSKIVDQGPVNAFTGLDVSSRISVSNILTPPEVKAARTPREGVLNYAQLYGGPNLQAVLSLADGVDLLIKGEQYRGFEKLVPWAFARNKMTAFRQATEGEKGLKLGDDVIEAELFYTGELVGQSVGLRPVLLSDVAAANRKARDTVAKVVNQRAAILDSIDRADRKGDLDASIAAREAKDKFNAKNGELFPKFVISTENVTDFKAGRDSARSESFGGFQYTPQNKIVAEQITDRSREALVKREQEIAKRKAKKTPGD